MSIDRDIEKSKAKITNLEERLKKEKMSIREKLALFQLNLQRKAEGLCEQTWEELTDVIRKSYLKWASQILALLREEGYMQLAKDQSLPKWQDNHLCVDIFSYVSSQQDMLNVNFRKVVQND